MAGRRPIRPARRRLRDGAVSRVHDGGRSAEARQQGPREPAGAGIGSRSTSSATHGPRATSDGTCSTRSSWRSSITVAQLVDLGDLGVRLRHPRVPRPQRAVRRSSSPRCSSRSRRRWSSTGVPSTPWGGSTRYPGLAVPFLATAFGTFLLRQVFLTLPRDLPRRGGDRRRRPPRLPAPRRRAAGAPDARRDGAPVRFLVDLGPVPVAQPHHDRVGHVHGAERAQAARQSRLDEPNLVMAGTSSPPSRSSSCCLIFQRQLLRGLTCGGGQGMSVAVAWTLALACLLLAACSFGRVDPPGRQRAASPRRRPPSPVRRRSPRADDAPTTTGPTTTTHAARFVASRARSTRSPTPPSRSS